jgi:hypothetical protein
MAWRWFDSDSIGLALVRNAPVLPGFVRMGSQRLGSVWQCWVGSGMDEMASLTARYLFLEIIYDTINSRIDRKL